MGRLPRRGAPLAAPGGRRPGGAARWWGRVPLRTRLVGLLLVLMALGLLVSGIAATAALRGYLFDELDATLTQAARGLSQGPSSDPRVDTGERPQRPGPIGQDFRYVLLTDADGTQSQALPPAPELSDPPDLPRLTVAQARETAGVPFVVDSESGSTRWRAVTMALADGSGSVTVAQDISGIDATVTRLTRIELAIGAVVLLLLGVAGWFLVRRSLRPLVGVEHAAATIAAGDLSHRAPTADPRTEVGSLALSFNTMVDGLQDAFAAQQESERAARQSEQAARASESRMRQFVADASHELRTPLTSVRGFAELYRIGAVPPGAQLDDTMARIEAEAARMGVLVEDLLMLARLDQARPLELAEVDLLDLVTDAAAAARAAAPERTVLVQVDPDQAPAVVAGDPVRLRQVVDNLLANALRYSPPDAPALLRVGTVGAGAALAAQPAAAGVSGSLSVPPDRWLAAVDVVDRGPGMPADVAARVFERFYREDQARSRAQGGAGLGLAIVAAITAAHGGRVEVRTSPGAGATFRLLLPLLGSPAGPDSPDLPDAADVPVVPAVSPAPAGPSPTRPATVP